MANRMEGWKDGRMEGWKDGRMEGWKGGKVSYTVTTVASVRVFPVVRGGASSLALRIEFEGEGEFEFESDLRSSAESGER